MLNQIEQKYTELFCPDEADPTGGQQLAGENRYPNTDHVNIKSHISGEDTFALDLVYTDSSGIEVCKAGVFDVDQIDEEGLEVARAIKEDLNSKGITACLSFSGRKGYHVIVVTEPVPKDIMSGLLEKTRAEHSFKGELFPSSKDGSRCKIAPCLHKISEQMSYFMEEKPYDEPIYKEDIPGGFWEKQLEIIEKIVPTKANILMLQAVDKEESDQTTDKSSEMVTPDFKGGDQMPPCIRTLIDKGGSGDIGTYDKNNLTLANYCKSAEMSPKESTSLAVEMAKNVTNSSVETTKNYRSKVEHFKSIQSTPQRQGQ